MSRMHGSPTSCCNDGALGSCESLLRFRFPASRVYIRAVWKSCDGHHTCFFQMGPIYRHMAACIGNNLVKPHTSPLIRREHGCLRSTVFRTILPVCKPSMIIATDEWPPGLLAVSRAESSKQLFSYPLIAPLSSKHKRTGSQRGYKNISTNQCLFTCFNCNKFSFRDGKPWTYVSSPFLSVLWLIVSIFGYKKMDSEKWAKSMFIYSLLHMTILFSTIILLWGFFEFINHKTILIPFF